MRKEEIGEEEKIERAIREMWGMDYEDEEDDDYVEDFYATYDDVGDKYGLL